MVTVGIDIGGKQHAVARGREGMDKADREVLKVTQDLPVSTASTPGSPANTSRSGASRWSRAATTGWASRATCGRGPYR